MQDAAQKRPRWTRVILGLSCRFSREVLYIAVTQRVIKVVSIDKQKGVPRITQLPVKHFDQGILPNLPM